MIAMFAFAIALALFILAPAEDNKLVRWYCLAVFYAMLLVKVLRPIVVVPGIPTYITPTSLFLIFSYVVFYWPYQADLLGIFSISESRWVWNTFPEFANDALLLTTMGFLSFFVAGVSTRPRSGMAVAPPGDRAMETRVKAQLHVGYFAPAVTVLLGVLIPAYSVSGLRSAGEGRYSDTTAGGSAADGLAAVITLLSMIACALVIAALAQRRAPGPWAWIGAGLALAWAARLVGFGDRNNATLIIIILVGGLATFCFRFRLPVVVGILLVSYVLYNAVEVVRHGDVSLSSIWLAILDSPSSDDTGETSFNISNVTVRAAIGVVPAEFDFGFGKYFLISTLGIIPYARSFLQLDGQSDVTSSILNEVMLRPGATWGVGTSVIADSYIEFGLIGVLVIMFVIGKSLAAAERWISQDPSSTWRIVFYLLILAIFSQLPRYAVGSPIRPLLWAILLMGVLRWLAVQRSIRGSRMRRAKGGLSAGQTPELMRADSSTA